MFLSCERKFEGTSSISFQLPQFPKVNSMTCTTCLKAIVIKIEGPGFDKIVFKKIDSDLKSSGSEITGDLMFDVPTGTARKFKLLAVYILNGQHILTYGEKMLDIPDTTPKTVQIDLLNQGVLHGGSIVGRYLSGISNGVEYGPTGLVDIHLPYNNDPDLNLPILQSQIINGWFDFFASETLGVTYTVRDQNLTLFENVSLNSLNPTSGDNTRARVHRPTSYYRMQNGSWTQENEKHDILYGFFGPAPTISSKVVCLEFASTLQLLTNMSTNGTSADMTYSHNNPAANIYGVGGTHWNNHASCNASNTAASRYESGRINVNYGQLDGQGNDTAKGFGSAFSYKYQTNVKKLSFTGNTASLRPLPGLFNELDPTNAIFDDVKLFTKANAAQGDYDEARCSNEWLTANGFTELASTTATVTSTDISVTIPTNSVSATDGAIFCPMKSSQLKDLGAYYVGSLSYASINISAPSAFSGPSSQAITLTNSGQLPTNFTVSISSASQFRYLGGVYPGTSGNCGNSLNPGSTCTVKIEYIGGASETATLNVQFSGQTTSQNLSGNP